MRARLRGRLRARLRFFTGGVDISVIILTEVAARCLLTVPLSTILAMADTPKTVEINGIPIPTRWSSTRPIQPHSDQMGSSTVVMRMFDDGEHGIEELHVRFNPPVRRSQLRAVDLRRLADAELVRQLESSLRSRYATEQGGWFSAEGDEAGVLLERFWAEARRAARGDRHYQVTDEFLEKVVALYGKGGKAGMNRVIVEIEPEARSSAVRAHRAALAGRSQRARAALMASIDKRPNGKWRARWREYPGGPQLALHFDSKWEANDHLVQVQHDLPRGLYVPPEAAKIGWATYVEVFLARQVWRERTRSSGTRAIGRATALWGDRPLGSIRRADVQSFVAQLELAPTSIAMELKHVAAVFKAAIDDGLIARNPRTGVKVPKTTKGKVDPLTAEQVHALHDAAPDWFKIAVVVGAGTGARQSEVRGLTLDRVRFLERLIRIDRQAHLHSEGWGPTKSKSGVRTVPTDAPVLDAISAHIQTFGVSPVGPDPPPGRRVRERVIVHPLLEQDTRRGRDARRSVPRPSTHLRLRAPRRRCLGRRRGRHRRRPAGDDPRGLRASRAVRSRPGEGHVAPAVESS